MEFVTIDVLVIGAGAAGLRAAIAAAEADPQLSVGLLSKSYPMGGHKHANEAGAAGVVLGEDSLDQHAADTRAAGAGLSDPAVVDYFVANCTRELVRLGRWGCPWTRQPNGRTLARPEEGMGVARGWHTARGTGFDVLDTLFRTSLAARNIVRYDDCFCVDLLVDQGRCQGALALQVRSGRFVMITARAVILATGGAGRVFRQSTSGGTVTGDGMALAYRHGVALRDMEFVQHHPTCLPGSGVALPHSCRSEGGILLNRLGQRYLQMPQDAGDGQHPELAAPAELVHAFWREQQAGRTFDTPDGAAVLLDLRSLGRAHLEQRLPGVLELVQRYAGLDAATTLIPVRPAVQYTMGGIATDVRCATSLPGLYAVGECASVGLHGANRIGANGLSELLVFGQVAGEQAATRARSDTAHAAPTLELQAMQAQRRTLALLRRDGGNEQVAVLRREMAQAMEAGCGIFRNADAMEASCRTLAQLRQRSHQLRLTNKAQRGNPAWLAALELGYQLDVAEAMLHSAARRAESRGAHQRSGILAGHADPAYARHTLAYYGGAEAPHISYADVGAAPAPRRADTELAA